MHIHSASSFGTQAEQSARAANGAAMREAFLKRSPADIKAAGSSVIPFLTGSLQAANRELTPEQIALHRSQDPAWKSYND